MRTNLYAHTEAHHPYPAFVSVNREEDGRVLMTVRERGHNGEKMATIELSEELLDAISLAFIDVRNVPDKWADRAGVAIQQALDRAAGWTCPKCGTDRTKAACPKGHSAALTGEAERDMSQRRNVTPWFPVAIDPVHEGIYEVEYRQSRFLFRREWRDGVWCIPGAVLLPATRPKSWRGLTAPARTMPKDQR